jgi:hypothetical protein
MISSRIDRRTGKFFPIGKLNLFSRADIRKPGVGAAASFLGCYLFPAALKVGNFSSDLLETWIRWFDIPDRIVSTDPRAPE